VTAGEQAHLRDRRESALRRGPKFSRSAGRNRHQYFAPRRGIAVSDPLGAVYQYNLTIEREVAKDVV
jgi:hypothetical protein